MIGSSTCSIQSLTSTQIVCTLGQNTAGTYPVLVQITDQGYSNSNVTFTYDLTLASLSSSQGGTAGGLSLTISGTGFDSSASNSTLVTICGNKCTITQSSYSSLTCIVTNNFILFFSLLVRIKFLKNENRRQDLHRLKMIRHAM